MQEKDLLTIKEAAEKAAVYRKRPVKPHNIAYLVNYAKIHSYDKEGNERNALNGETLVSWKELKEYYDIYSREREYKEALGDHINWSLSFEDVPESESTKHVHRLHPYKGKFIPQLVEYFLNDKVNGFKKEVYFQKGDTILDPFAGSGTTLVECFELGLNSIGLDISKFNCMIIKAKTEKYNLNGLDKTLLSAANATIDFSLKGTWGLSQQKLDAELSRVNKVYFTNPEFKFLVGNLRKFRDAVQKTAKVSNKHNGIDPLSEALKKLDSEKENLLQKVIDFITARDVDMTFTIDAQNIMFLEDQFTSLYSTKILDTLKITPSKQSKLMADFTSDASECFLTAWYTQRQRSEMQYYLSQIDRVTNPKVQDLMRVILSRTIRSCRATTHSDLATLTEPQTKPYYCTKHYKICTPVTTIASHLKRYTIDTLTRLEAFSKLRQDVFSDVINADARVVDIFSCVRDNNLAFAKILKERKIAGIFTSPPYVGQIDYHEQHAYAYELFDIERKDALEIGRQEMGTGKRAQNDYVEGISEVLINCQKYLKDNFSIFIVANDNRNLYGTIAEKANLRIIETFYRPVLNRTERDKQPYSEAIFHMKAK
ncbi:MAG: site-specific DNA-methyltransferase [Candidatus Bathyarchaeota archaeon]|nr:site-specific DNA-methyltransferase [Candidatus Bathyarchaeota archaeon]